MSSGEQPPILLYKTMNYPLASTVVVTTRFRA